MKLPTWSRVSYQLVEKKTTSGTTQKIETTIKVTGYVSEFYKRNLLKGTFLW